MQAEPVIGGVEEAQHLRRTDLPTGVVTLVFTDIEGSTRLLRTLGPRYAELLAAHSDILRSAASACGGCAIRSEGDALFFAFEDPARAVAACAAAQRGMLAYEWPADCEFKVRIGVHTGHVDVGGDDYIGLAVHQAARVSSSAHGGQTVISEATRRLLAERLPEGAYLARLGSYRLKDFPEPTAIYQLCHPDLPSEFPALRASPAAAHNVPESATLFVGRQTAISELAELVSGRRLVTVLGAGGVGKTRLATEVVPLVVADFADGVWMVELSKLRDGQAVAAEVAATLGVRAEAERSIEHLLADALEDKDLLLLLDNCEHVLDDLAPLIEALISSCPRLHVLATSREPLSLPVERRFPLAPLSLPEETGGAGGESEAVALFVDRAQVVAPQFDLDRERAAVVEICRRLDGLPLAIELAAARAAAIPLSRMAARLDRRFSVLRRSHRGRLAHHETLRASIEWSFELLEDEERVLLARLAVFTGAFELEGAEAVCGEEPLEPDEMLDLLARLIEKSLLQQAGERYVMLESIREFAREQLERMGEVEPLVLAHVRYYTGVVEQAAREAGGRWQREALDRLDADLPNIRTAVQRALDRSDPAALRLSAALGQYGFIRNRLGEVAQWCIDAAAIPDAPADLRARALNQAGFALVLMGSPDGGQALVEDGLELARAAGDPVLLAESLLMAADLRLEAGREEEAAPLAREAVELIGSLQDDSLLGRALLLLARAEHGQSAPEATAERLSGALAVVKRSGDLRQAGRILVTCAYLRLEAGDLEAAEDDATQCLEICRQLDHTIGEAVARVVLVWVAIERGQPGRARELLERCLITARECGYLALLAYCVAAQAALALDAGEDEHAARILGTLGTGEAMLGGEGARAMSLRVAAMRERLEASLGGAFPRLLNEGARMTLHDVAAETLPAT